MADKEQPVIIIRKKKGGGHGGHHGGAWKVAYADFVTAMMSFFLLLWILNTTTSDQRKGLAEYFAPAGISESHGGAGGVMGGQSITAVKGAQMSDTTPPGIDQRTIPTPGEGEEGEDDQTGKSKSGDEGTGGVSDMLKDAAANAEAMRREEESFKQAEEILKNAIAESEEFRDLAQSIMIDRTPEGLRIQIVDRDKFSLFPSGSSLPFERGRDLLRLVGRVVARLPNHISISGHTDSAPFVMGGRRDNWGLSADRANVSRTELITAGVDPNRVERIVGLSDRDPLYPKMPQDPKNRRISIVLLREKNALKSAPAKAANPAAPTASPTATPAASPKTPPAASKP